MTRQGPPAAAPTGPAHARIAAALRALIQGGELPLGAPLPSERELALSYGVSRMTARQALMILESEGHARRQSSVGTTVSRRLPMRIGSFSDEIARGGAVPGDRLLSAELQQVSPPVAMLLGLKSDAKVHAITRLRTADGEPVALENTYFPVTLTPALLEERLEDSLWQLVRERYGLVPAHAEASLEVITLDETAATLLGARVASPGILLRRTTFDSRGRAIECANDFYRSDRVRFNVSEFIEESSRVETSRSSGPEGARQPTAGPGPVNAAADSANAD